MAVNNIMPEISWRSFDFRSEPLTELRGMYELTYGAKVDESVWEWKYVKNPDVSGIKMIVAVADKRIVGATTRMPADLLINNEVRKAYFNVDSMVHPDFRRLGIMQSLYGYTASVMPIQYSKGTNPGMYGLLKKIGYRDVLPNTFMVKYLSIPKLLLNKIRVYSARTGAPPEVRDNCGEKGFIRAERFGPEFDEFHRRVSPGFGGVLIKDSERMNWRYNAIPHRQYHVFYRKKGGKIVSVAVMRIKEVSGSIVDILWDRAEGDEPRTTVRFCAGFLKSAGALKVTCWATLDNLRAVLKENGFIDNNETPRFSVFAPNGMDVFANGGKIHFVEGDGDSEYL